MRHGETNPGAWHTPEYFGPPLSTILLYSLDHPRASPSPPASDFRCSRNNIWRTRRSVQTSDVMVKTEFGHYDV